MSERLTQFPISAIVFQDGDWWCGQCLEYDIGSQARTLPDLHVELYRILNATVLAAAEEKLTPFAGLKPAPKKYWELFAQARLRIEADDPQLSLPDGIDFPPIIVLMKIAEPQPAFA